MLLAGAAYAQDPQPAAAKAGANAPAEDKDKKTADKVETVVVTGLRHSIETSVQTKRNADSIVEVVSAEDIGKLPDISIAESLARLPGLTAQRVDGRAQVISIRGMAPKYGVTLLNGREMVSTGDNRSVEYDQFPSELINKATVYKTPDAALSAQGLSGTLNMQTVRPLDFKSRVMNANIRGEYNSNGSLNNDSDALGGRVSFSYIDQFANNTIGVALGYAHLDNPGQEKYYKSWWWADPSVWGGHATGLADGTTALQGFEAGVKSSDRKRDGLMGVLEFKPNKDFHSVVDLFYSKFDQTSSQRELQTDIWGPTAHWGWVTPGSYASPVVSNGILTGATINGVSPVLLNRYNERKDDVFAIGWNNELKRDKWTFAADLAYSRAKRDEYNGELTAQASSPTSLAALIDTTNSGPSKFTPSVDYTDPASALLTEVWGRGGRASMPHVKDEMKTLQLTAKRDLEGVISSVEGGLKYSNRTKDMNRTEEYYYLNNGHTPVAVSSDLLVSPSSLGFAGIPGVLAWDYNGVLGKYYTAGVPAALDAAPGRIWNVGEKVSTVYGKVNFDIEGKVPVRGNLGVQVVRADQKSTGVIWDGTSLITMSGGKTYTDVLPSLNATFDMGEVLSPNTYVRFGAAKEMARPNMEDMRSGFSDVTVQQAGFDYFWKASGGNPTLEPWRADAFDLSIEKYFGKRSYLGAAVFKKNLKSFVYTQDINFKFEGFPNPTTFTPTSVYGTLTAPANGHGGNIHGLELSGALDFGLLNPSLEGFGFIVGWSHTESNLHEANNPSKPLDGLSGIVRNLTLYYEKNGYSARISERFRSKFQTTVRNQFGDNVSSAIDAEKIVDLQLGYAWETGSFKGLSVLFQVNNLLDTPYKTEIGSATNGSLLLPERYETFGRQYLLGLSYKM